MIKSNAPLPAALRAQIERVLAESTPWNEEVPTIMRVRQFYDYMYVVITTGYFDGEPDGWLMKANSNGDLFLINDFGHWNRL